MSLLQEIWTSSPAIISGHTFLDVAVFIQPFTTIRACGTSHLGLGVRPASNPRRVTKPARISQLENDFDKSPIRCWLHSRCFLVTTDVRESPPNPVAQCYLKTLTWSGSSPFWAGGGRGSYALSHSLDLPAISYGSRL